MTAHGVTHIRRMVQCDSFIYFTHTHTPSKSIHRMSDTRVVHSSKLRNLYGLNKENMTNRFAIFIPSENLNNFFYSVAVLHRFYTQVLPFFIHISLYHFLFDSNHVIKISRRTEKNVAARRRFRRLARQQTV